MQISEQGITLIRQFEGFSATPYLCPAGKLTIGYGHVVRPNEQFPASGISEEEAEIILKQDVNYSQAMVNHCVLTSLTQHQFDALVSLVYNIGVKAFVNSTLLQYLNEGNTQAAADEFGHWVYSNGEELAGLVTRRAAESKFFKA